MRTTLLLFLFTLLSQCIIGQTSNLTDIDNSPVQLTSTISEKKEQVLSEYISHRSISGHEKMAGDFLKETCRQAGLVISTFGDTDGNYNFSASVYPLESRKPNIIFLHHIDVVPAKDSAEWINPPFEGTISEGHVWGRGAFDNKGVGIMHLFTLSHFVRLARESELPFNISLLAVSCEETQCEGGARYVAEHHLDELNPWFMIGEGPPSLEGILKDPGTPLFAIATGHKRPYWIQLDLKVETNGHGSVTPLEYATKDMVLALKRILSKKPRVIFTRENVGILKKLGRIEGGIKGFVLRHPKFFKPFITPALRKQPEMLALFTNTVTLTHISNSAETPNVIPENVRSTLDCRLLPHTDEHLFLDKLLKKIRHEDIAADVLMETPATYPSQSSHPAFHLLKKAIKDKYGEKTQIATILLPNFNDSGWFRLKGVPVFDVTPVQMSRADMYCVHGNNERIPVTALEEGTEVYVDFLCALIRDFSRPEKINGLLSYSDKKKKT